MKAIIFGVQKIDFNGQDGQEIKGLKIHYGYVPTRGAEDVAGFKYDSTFVRPDFTGLIFGEPASKIFQNFAAFKSSIKFPAMAKVNFELEGKKAIFSGCELEKEEKKND